MISPGQNKLDVDQPFYVIELGGGSGKFSYYMVKALMEMKVKLYPLAG